MSFQDILQWWNLIYAAPLLISLVWIVATVITGVDSGGHDAGGDVSHDLDAEVSHDLDADMSHDLGADASSDAGADVLHGGGTPASHGHTIGHVEVPHDVHHGDDRSWHDASALSKLFSLLGIGQAPVTLLIGTFMLCWGAFGLVANRVLEDILKYPGIYILPSVGLTLVASFTTTRLMAAMVGRYMPANETYAVPRSQLVGLLGRAVYTISEGAGTVDVRDVYGTLHRVQAKTEIGAEAILAGAEVIVIDLDEIDKRFVVSSNTL